MLTIVKWAILQNANRGIQAEKFPPLTCCACLNLQEVGNVPYVVDNGAGVFSRSPKETAKLVAEWFGPKREELKRMSENALKLSQPDAVFNIVKDIDELARQRGPMPKIEYSLTSSFSYPI